MDWGGEQHIDTKQVVDSVAVTRASSGLSRAMSDSRLYRCRPPVVTRDSQAVNAKFLKVRYVF